MAAPRNESGTFDIGGDLTVHRLGFGALWLTGPDGLGRPDDEADARALVRRAVELGVDFVDTADAYGPGVSERLVGEALGPDDDVVVASKTGQLRDRSGGYTPHGDPEYLHNQVLCSLDRLQTETIDLYQYHRPDPDTPFEDSLSAFAEMKDAGQIRHVGLSNVTVEQLERATDVVDVATVQNRYSVGDREHEPVLDACERHDIGFIPWGPLYTVGDGAVAGVLDEVARAHDATPEQVALEWLLEHSPVTLPIPGTADATHLEENVAASGIDLTGGEMARLDDAAPPESD